MKKYFRKRIRQPLWWSTIILSILSFFLFIAFGELAKEHDSLLNELDKFGLQYDPSDGKLFEKDTKDYKETTESQSSSTSSSTEQSSSSATSSSSQAVAFDENSYTTVDYNEWNHDKIEKAKLVQITGKVIQVLKESGDYNLRVAVDDDYDKIVLVSIESYNVKDVIAEDDNVTVFGLAEGITTYKTTLGSSVTIPFMNGTNYRINSYGN